MAKLIFLKALFLGITLPLITFAADTPDGLDPIIRKNVYNKDTFLAGRYDLTKMNKKMIDESIRGMFDDSSWAIVSKKISDLKTANDSIFQGLEFLVSKGFTQSTFVGFEEPLHLSYSQLIPLGEKVDEDLFNAISVGFSLLVPGYEMTQQEGYAVISKKRGPELSSEGLHSDMLYDPSVEEMFLRGLSQARPGATIIWTAIMKEKLREQVSGWFEQGPLAKALMGANYIGGYFIGGPRPEFIKYVGFPSEDSAKAFGEMFKQHLQASITKAIADDKANQEGSFTILYYTTSEEMTRKIVNAIKTNVFEKTFIMTLDTTSLRDITSALVDHYLRDVVPPEKPAVTTPKGAPKEAPKEAPKVAPVGAPSE